MSRARCSFVFLLMLALLAACTGSRVQRREDQRLPKLRAMGYRIAVVPFRVTAPDEGLLETALGPVGEVLTLDGAALAADRGNLADLMRNDVVAWLRQSPFDVVEPWVTDTQLAHAALDRASMADPQNVARIAAVLQVDGVLFGDLQRWNRSYYVVQSVAEVGLELELRDRDGTSLFSTMRTETVGAGLSGGPTGYGSAITAPVEGLSGARLRDLGRAVARNAALDLGAAMPDAEAALLVPRLSVVSLVQNHGGPVLPMERIDVVAVGTPDCEVRFDLGRLRTGVPMRAVATIADPRGARTVYEGHYVVQPDDPAITVPLYVTIDRDPLDRERARRTQSRYRWDGDVRIATDPFVHFGR
ncbi:MAG: hypothetical protein ABL997_02935 [Planctomycetota bacterium]